MQLDDLYFTDDLALLQHMQQQIQEKTTSVEAVSTVVGLIIHKRKSKIRLYNTTQLKSHVTDVKTFAYLHSIIHKHGGYDADMKVRIGKGCHITMELEMDMYKNDSELFHDDSLQTMEFTFKRDTHSTTNTGEDDQCRSSPNSSRSQHTQKEKQDSPIQHNTTCTNQITHDGETLNYVKTFTYLRSIIHEHGGYDADVELRIGKVRVTYLHLKNICNSKQLSTSQHQGHNSQYKCQHSSTVRGGNLENFKSHHRPEDTNFYYQLSKENTSDPLTKHYQQQTIVGENKPDPIGGMNQEKELEVDGTHIEENTQLCHNASPHMESSRSKEEEEEEERKTKEHIIPRNGDRHEKNEQQLDRSRKEGLG
ncbi:unnamed protein product [Schistosoma margrebowiei]|uniref:Uncharacterized protein n=1 Tax=Schistosoma margrebowiei TaxID=48269 RepID=A0A183LXA8_9TREM|nr:unnamed protein product [Schistosoma margrebowiei]